MLLTDERGRILLANPRAEALLERGGHALLGSPLPDVFLLRERETLAERIRHSVQHGSGGDDMEASILHPHGPGGLVLLTFLPLREAGQVRLLVLIRDLTLERSARDSAAVAERAAERAEAEDLRKLADLGRITSAIVHEVKTPLTYVNNNLVLQRQVLEEFLRAHPQHEGELQLLRESVESAYQGAGRMTRLLLDLRPLSQNRPSRRAPCDLATVVMDALDVFRATHAGATRVEVDLESTHPVDLDRDEIVQALLNLLQNAAQAQPEGGVIRVVTRNRDIAPTIRVIDHGPGIPPDRAAELFKPFRTTKKEGTGLGLFISRRIIESHGGSLTHEPTPGGGATFVIRFGA